MSDSAEKFQSPFLDVTSFPKQQSETIEETTTPPVVHTVSSPFVSVYEMEDGEARVDPESEEFIQFLGELHDQEFDDAVFEIVNEASALYEDRFIHEYKDMSSQTMESERFLQQHLAPLQNELETLVESMANDLENRDFEAMTETEIDAFIDSYTFSGEINLPPDFENWGVFNKIKNAVKNKIKKAAKWAKRKARALAAKAFKAALKKIIKYFRPMLEKVLKLAIGKLPKKYQGMANLLRKKLGYEIEEQAMLEGGLDTVGEIDQIQQEFDLFIANLLYTDDETKQELMLAEIINESEQPIADPLADLDRAREQFIEGMLDLKEGEDPAPVVENFLPAVMWAVKIGLKFYGRPKLVKYLAKYLARLIRRYVGRKYAFPLSKVIVDAGLRLVNLEVTEQDAMHTAGEAVASMVEDTLYEVANLPEYILDDEELLEGFVLEAFEKAATRNLPEILPEEAYIKRPSLRESKGLKGAWIRKLKRRKRSHKKFTRAMKTRLSYHTLRAIKSFAEVPLSEILQDQYGLPAGTDLEATVHLFEATPGNTLAQISRYEDSTPGLGSGKYAYTQLHPLTPEAAGMLFGQPGLGRTMPGRYLNNRRTIGVGQRFYYLEIPGAQLQMMPVSGSTTMLRRSNGLKLTLDFSRQQILVCLYLNETNAQNIAAKLRQNLPLGSVMTVLKSIMELNLMNLFSAGTSGQIKIIHEAIPPQQASNSLVLLPQPIKSKLEIRLLDWLGKGLSNYFRQQSQGFIAATEDPADGITLKVTLDNPPNFALLRKALQGSPVSIADINFSGDISEASVKSIPGYYSD